VSIGEGAIVGARSVVKDDVEPFTIVAGNPARVIRRFREEEIRYGT
jgi:Serine acetyltransferase